MNEWHSPQGGLTGLVDAFQSVSGAQGEEFVPGGGADGQRSARRTCDMIPFPSLSSFTISSWGEERREAKEATLSGTIFELFSDKTNKTFSPCLALHACKPQRSNARTFCGTTMRVCRPSPENASLTLRRRGKEETYGRHPFDRD